MKKNYWYIVFFAAFAFLMMSCADDEIIETPFISSPSKTIAFNADIEWPEPDQTRSASPNRVSNFSLVSDTGEEVLPCGVYVQDGIYPNNDEKPLTRGAVINSIGSSFNVWATYTDDEGSSSAYFSNLKFTKGSGDVFSSQGTTYYWPGSGTIDFVAVANTPSSGFTPIMSSGKLESFTYTVPTEATDQSDIIVATAKNVAGNKNASVPLSFKHIMSAVNVKIGKVVPGEIRSITFKNVYNKGEYLVDQGVWVVDKTSIGDFTVHMEGGEFVSSGDDAKDTPVNTAAGTFMFIPQNPGENAEMVIEFYDSTTKYTYADGDDDTEHNALRGSIKGDNWDMSKTVNYMLSIDESFTLTIEPVGKKLDAHYVIGYANVTVKDIGSWIISATASDMSEVTILPEEEVNVVAKEGFWTDYEVDDSGNKISDNSPSTGRNGYKSARGLSSWSGSGDVSNKLFYIFIPENIGNTDRQINLELRSTEEGSTASTTKVLLQKNPNWTDRGFGWEVVDDEEEGEYGFKFTRKRTFIFPYKLGSKSFPVYAHYTKDEAMNIAKTIINSFNATSFVSAEYYTQDYVTTRMYVQVDYTKLNTITGASSTEDGYANTLALYDLGGIVTTGALEVALENTKKTESGHEGEKMFRNPVSSDDIPSSAANVDVTLDADGNSKISEDLKGAITYILKKNRYYFQKKIDSEGNSTAYYAYFKRDDIKWYMPACGQFSVFTSNPNIENDIPHNYWSSTAENGEDLAYRGDQTLEDRTEKLRVIAVRRDENGYGTATVQVNNGSLAGGENGNSDTWVE